MAVRCVHINQHPMENGFFSKSGQSSRASTTEIGQSGNAFTLLSNYVIQLVSHIFQADLTVPRLVTYPFDLDKEKVLKNILLKTL